jgi:hypothetical protein
MIPIRCLADNTKWTGRVFNKGDITKLGRYQSLPNTFEYPKGKLKTLPLPKVNGGKIILLGDGPSGKNFNNKENYEVAVVNKVGIWYSDKISYWITVHPEKLAKFILLRKKNGFLLDNIKYIGNGRVRNPLLSFYPSEFGCGSSSLYALYVLEQIGYSDIHLVGVDLTNGYEKFRKYWEDYQFNSNITSSCSDWMNRLIENKMKKV